jgi:hypothetical protein
MKNNKKDNNKYYCEKCDYQTTNKTKYDRHLLTPKHNISTNSNEKENNKENDKENDNNKYYCKHCDYHTLHKGLWNRHLLTLKHNILTNSIEKREKKEKKEKEISLFICECGKKYKHKSTLSNHKKECIIVINNISTINNITNSNSNKNDKELIKHLVEANQDLTNKIVELAKEPKTINNTTNNTNNTNNTTNNMTINVFLNEKCKDAINLIDFIKNLNITWDDTAETKDICIEQSLTNLIMDKVKDMDITERPIHCTDKKRLQYYVKDGEWKTKDIDIVFDKVLYDLSKKHVNNLAVYGEEHPEWIQNDDNTEMYFGITTNCMIYKHEMERRRNKVKKLLSDKVLLKKEDIQI